MEGFKNTTRMKTFGDVAPQAYAKGGSVKPMVKAAAKAPAKAKDCAPMKKAGGGDVSKMTRDQRMASMEKSSRAMTPAETRSMQAIKAAKAAAPKQGPLIKPAREMTPAERRMNQMDRPTNNMGAEAYKGGGKVGGSKVPFAVKKVMRKAEGGAVAAPQGASPVMEEFAPSYFDANGKLVQSPPPLATTPARPTPMPEMPQEPTPQSVFGNSPPTLPNTASIFGTSPGPMPEMPQEPTPQSVFGGVTSSGFGVPNPSFDYTQPLTLPPRPQRQPSTANANDLTMQQIGYQFTPEGRARTQAMLEGVKRADAARAADQAATLQAQQEMAAQAQMDRGLGRGLAPMYGRGAPPRFMR